MLSNFQSAISRSICQTTPVFVILFQLSENNKLIFREGHPLDLDIYIQFLELCTFLC